MNRITQRDRDMAAIIPRADKRQTSTIGAQDGKKAKSGQEQPRDEEKYPLEEIWKMLQNKTLWSSPIALEYMYINQKETEGGLLARYRDPTIGAPRHVTPLEILGFASNLTSADVDLINLKWYNRSKQMEGVDTDTIMTASLRCPDCGKKRRGANT
jgi:hypothetical protein